MPFGKRTEIVIKQVQCFKVNKIAHVFGNVVN